MSVLDICFKKQVKRVVIDYKLNNKNNFAKEQKSFLVLGWIHIIGSTLDVTLTLLTPEEGKILGSD